MEFPIIPLESLAYGYRQGIFPMSDIPGLMDEDSRQIGRIEWYRPHDRALFPIEGMRVSKSLAKFMRAEPYEIRFDTEFEAVIRKCRRPYDNWIDETIVQTYLAAYKAGWGHCAECWEDGNLIGGVYGVAVGAVFCAESMFHRKTNGSKIALYHLIERCRLQGFTTFDVQIMNPHLESLGAYEMTQDEYLALIKTEMLKTTLWGLSISGSNHIHAKMPSKNPGPVRNW